ncbi:MAG: hypothetical protein RL154_872 [Pseudomonadota bacterium]
MLGQLTDTEPLSASGIQSYVLRKAFSISKTWLSDSHQNIQHLAVVGDIDVLSPDSTEVILMMDDVGVKAQKPHKVIARQAEDAKRLDTTVILVQTPTGQYEYATSGIDKEGNTIYPVNQAIIDKVVDLHGIDKPLPIVAITDGARSIRNTLHLIFGMTVCIILDWYHLQHKVKNLMSMIATNKEDKILYINDLNSLLWNGEVDEAIIYLDDMRRVKNQAKHKELRDYLEKHKDEIINYSTRKANGKTIGSGRGEKGNDLIVAHRQKKKGMAWSRKGSSALAILKTYRLNAKSIAA